MKRIEQFVQDIVEGLPLDADEQQDMREELTSHLVDHIDDLMIKGYTKNEAVEQAISSFGKEATIHKEMKKVLFPYYKFVRFFFSVMAVSVLLCVTSHFITKHYFPRHDTAITVGLFFLVFMICTFILGVLELIFEAIEQEYASKLVNPWVLFFIPAVILQIVLLVNQLTKPDLTDFWIYEDYVFYPLYVVYYVLSRQLFTWLFVRKKTRRTRVKTYN